MREGMRGGYAVLAQRDLGWQARPAAALWHDTISGELALQCDVSNSRCHSGCARSST